MRAIEGAQVVAERLVEPRDPLAWYRPSDGFAFLRHGRGVVARGAALSISVPAGADQVARAAALARDALGRVRRPQGGPAPVVVGALPFDGRTPASLVIPRDAVIRTGDEPAWRLRLAAGGDDQEAPEPPRLDRPAAGFGTFELDPVPEPEAYVAAVAEARRRIVAGTLEKVVLARMLVARGDRGIDRAALLARLREREPDAYAFAVHGFVGATPELLVERSGREVRSNPLAGTVARGADAAEDREAGQRLLGSRKDLLEHAPVVEAVRRALAPACETVRPVAAPSLLATGAVWHLSTSVEGVLREPAPSALELAALLHPTPAVCGTPPAEAMSAIGELEAIDRTLYAGIVGWMDADGDGGWAVVLRCAEIQGRIALLFAGAGIVADSDPRAELDETDAKFGSMLGALGIGAPAH